MTREETLAALLRSALAAPRELAPPPELWGRLLERDRARIDWSWLDVGLAAAVLAGLLLLPGGLWLLAYNL